MVEEYEVGDVSIGGELTLLRLTPITPEPPNATLVDSITVAKGNGTSIENPIGNVARIYVGSAQFASLKNAMKKFKEGTRPLVVRYVSTPKPSRKPTYEEISSFSHILG